ncbi:MAG: sulfatase-like hydrolase/transferase [Desulfuromusa sp.]|nr:sulfatase-like hydrolase/transferase [Desulfuromusa sp.]
MAECKNKNNMLDKTLNRRDALKMMGAVGATGMMAMGFPEVVRAALGATKKQPNIVFILGDNHNAKDMGFAGHPFLKTPGMDRLAKEGVHFENTFNTTSLCSPSRASILTGAYAHKHGIKNNHTPWTGQMPIFLENFSKNGYGTAFIGKWHMPGEGLPDFPFLDLFVSYTHNEGQGSYFDCPMIVNGKEVPSRKSFITEEVTDYAIEFMQKNEAEQKPFCIYLAHRAAHPPFDAPKDIDGMYDANDVKQILPKNVDPTWYGKTGGNVFQGTMMGSYYDQYRGYCETITAMDRDIERLLDQIDEMGLAENTIVIYMGDNGMQWGTHGCHGIREPYEDSAKLPLIIRAPGLVSDPGSKRKQMALNIDLAPTLLDYAGVPIPEEMDGESLLPLLRNSERKGIEACLMEYWRYFPENTPSYVGVRTDRYKYIEFERGRSPWLFDLEKDPGENNNLYGSSEAGSVLPELLVHLKRLTKNENKFR